MITVGRFIRMLSEDTSWTIGEDFGSDEDVLLRKNCARIIHRFLQKVMGEPDETSDLPSQDDIRDLFDCRICAPHIIQVVAKKIMKPCQRGSVRLFEGDTEVSEPEAHEYIRLININNRVK